jgi:iron complex outermembrane receptor protein
MKSLKKRSLLKHIVSITLMTCLVSLGTVKRALSQPQSDSVAVEQVSNLSSNELVTTVDLEVLSVLQGRVAGLSAYKRGSNPNGSFSYRIKGFISNELTEPLYVVNGIPMLSQETIHPMDIQSVQVLTSVAEILPYGLRAAHGVIEIETNQPGKITENNAILTVDATSFVALSSVSKAWNVFGRNEFLNAGGNDLGEETDWQEVVSRSALSTVHQLRISGKSNQSAFSVSGSIQDREGVLKESGNVQRTFRADVYQLLLEDKLRISAQTSLVSRDIDFSFTEAFRYATVQNPTSPIRFDNGNFYQPIQFDNYNPLSIIELNEHEGKTSQTLMSGSISYEILPSVHINSYFAHEQRQFSRSEFYAPNSFFRGLTNNGMIRFSDASQELTSTETTATFRQQWKNVRLKWETGFSIWNKSIQTEVTQIRNIPMVDSYQNLELEPIFSSGNEALFEFKQSQSPELINLSLFSTARST